jgi:predicted Zn finger-like uncharacterized protein
MKITCDSCGAKYTIADDKVRGRKVKIRCKGCGTAIVVDGQQDKASASTSDAPPSAEGGEPGVPLEMGAASAPPPSGADGAWSVNLSETDQRTLSTQEVVDGWKRGEITADAFVWREGMADWVPILESTDLKPLLSAAKEKSSPTAARASATPAARVTGGRAQGGADLFAAAATAGADDDDGAAAPAPIPARPPAGRPPTPGASASEEAKPTGARNENSVLFSLDALKAGFAGPAPKQEPPKKASERVGADALLGSPTSGPAPMFSFADNNALLTAPAPPEPPKPKIVEAFSPSAGGAAPAAGGSKKIVFALVGLLILVIGGGAAALSINSKNKEEALAAAAASASAAIQKAKEEEAAAKEAAEKALEEKRQEEERARLAEQKAKEAAATPAAAAAASASAAATPGAPGAAGAAKPGSAGTSSGSASAKKDDKKKDEAPAAPAGGSDQPFSKAAAVSALSAAAGSAGSCKKLGGPTGTGRVTVTFAPSGRVTTANVEGAPYAGTSVGGCVASLFRKAHIPAFSGNAVTVSKSFSIN